MIAPGVKQAGAWAAAHPDSEIEDERIDALNAIVADMFPDEQSDAALRQLALGERIWRHPLDFGGATLGRTVHGIVTWVVRDAVYKSEAWMSLPEPWPRQ